jgi:hypothetical protein
MRIAQQRPGGLQYVAFFAVAVTSAVSVYVSVDVSAAVVADNVSVAVAQTLLHRGGSMYDAASLLLKRGQHVPMSVAMKQR